MEKLGTKRFENDKEKWLKLADKLDELQKTKNEGRGVGCVRSIILSLRSGRIEEAKAICWNEGDKIGSYEDIKELLRPIDGLNGSEDLLKIFELNELISVMQQFLQKIDKELIAKK